jgi:hypothetical protein
MRKLLVLLGKLNELETDTTTFSDFRRRNKIAFAFR